MSTTLYLTAAPPLYTPATLRGAWDDTAGHVTRALDRSTNGGGTITSVARAETNANTQWDVLLYRGVSGPLAAQTISGTVDLIVGALESNAAADCYWHIHLYVTQGDSDTPRGTLLANYLENTTNEWPTTAAGMALQSAQTLSSLAVSDGDRMVVELGYIARNAVTTSRTGTLWYGTETNSGEAGTLTVGGDETALAGHLAFSADIAEPVIPTRLSQAVLETLGPGTHAVRLSQAVLETLGPGTHAVRLSQAVLETLSRNATAPVRLSQLVLEVMSSAPVTAPPTGRSQAVAGGWGGAGTFAG